MRRAMDEILASQKQMLSQRGEPVNAVQDEEMARLFEKHLEYIQGWLLKQSNFKVLYISYNDVLRDPQPNIIRVNQFLGSTLDHDAMARVLDQSLYRQRKESSP
jgi:hypothetical protein